jgi:hypothetical protein
MIVQPINLYSFRDAFKQAGRENQFSYEGLGVLFDGLQDFSESDAKPYELDVISLCCEYTEMSLSELLESYDITDEKLTDDNEVELLGLATDYLSDNTWLCGITENNTFVFQAF